MKKSFHPATFLLPAALLTLSGCGLFNGNTPSYTPDVQWTLETNMKPATSYIAQKDRYLYLVETVPTAEDSTAHQISKVDLENGTYVWHSTSFSGYTLADPVICGGCVFLEKKATGGELPSSIYCFSDENGELSATITVGNTEREKHAMRICNWSLYPVEDTYLIWSNGYIKEDYDDFDFGILRIALSSIDFDVSPEEEQYIKPETLLKSDRSIYTWFTGNGPVIYYTTYSEFDDSPDCITGAINAVTGEKLWSRESSDMRGNAMNGLYYLNDEERGLTDRLYSFEYYAGCYDGSTGETLWERIQTQEEIKSEVYLGAHTYNKGVFYSDGCFYYTTDEAWDNSGIERERSVVTNIKCVDAETGEVRWAYMPYKSSSLFTRPIVANGKVFVLTFGQGLYVFDKDTGELLGVDASVYTKGYEKNAIYNGNVIYFDFSTNKGILTAIKP